ncbi:MAG: succinylglutamate desuccinylase/aspartoacylase family protein [Halobacteriales archaeon]|nr:succinylglutamate desuccinylase/aspartoacylase family protein [Halobacteriales archaeon]
MQIGSADASPGALARGYLEIAELPTAIEERLPVIVAEGVEDGPTLWIHGSIHGDEATGLAVAQDVMTEDLPTDLRGTIVCIPNVNPAGLRRNSRTSYYHNDDPNRYFPHPETGPRPPNLQEQIDARLFDLLTEHADALVDLHTAGVNSMPFIIRNDVPYGGDRSEAEARTLSAEIDELGEAFGLPVVATYETELKEAYGLHRSTTSAAIRAGIPAITPELGSHSVVNDSYRQAGISGVENVLRTLDMHDGTPKPNDHAPDAPVDFPVKRSAKPYAPTTGIARYRVTAGDAVEPEDPLVDIVAPNGEHRTTVEAPAAGFVIGRREGVAAYENDRLLSMAVRDESDRIVENGT